VIAFSWERLPGVDQRSIWAITEPGRLRNGTRPRGLASAERSLRMRNRPLFGRIRRGTPGALGEDMTAPRQILPGTTYLITRRCTQREFLLRPSVLTNAIFMFVLAVAARRAGVIVHAFCVMSDHVHVVLTDVCGRLPEFERYLHGTVARALNVLLGRSQAFWDDAGCSAVALATPEAVIDATAYVLANPVAAGLVANGLDWPGLWSNPGLIGGQAIVAERPSVFFRKKGPLPASASLQLLPPPGFTADEFRSAVVSALAAHEQNARAAVAASGRPFLGVHRILSQKTTTRAARPEKRGRLHPKIATRNRARRVEELARISEFLVRYRSARERFMRGVRDVVFPAGTYWLRVSCGVACEAAG
jgi:putative transposase